MGFKKGHVRYGGRQKGSENKDRKTCLEIVEGALGKPLMQEWIELYTEVRKTNKALACRAIEGISKYCMPTMQSVQVQTELTEIGNDQVSNILAKLQTAKDPS